MKRYDEVGEYYQDFREVEEGDYCKYDDHLAAMKELTNRLAKVEKERDELKRGKSCADCSVSAYYEDEPCCVCKWRNKGDYFKPRDPSAEKGGGK